MEQTWRKRPLASIFTALQTFHCRPMSKNTGRRSWFINQCPRLSRRGELEDFSKGGKSKEVYEIMGYKARCRTMFCHLHLLCLQTRDTLLVFDTYINIISIVYLSCLARQRIVPRFIQYERYCMSQLPDWK